MGPFGERQQGTDCEKELGLVMAGITDTPIAPHSIGTKIEDRSGPCGGRSA